MEIYLLRHGEAGQRVPVATRDLERALTAAGKEEIAEVGEALAEMGYEFDVIAASPLKRAKDTASIVNKALKRKSGIEEWPELSPERDREAFYKRLAKIKPGSAVMCVGHEPFLTSAISEIAGKGNGESSGFRIALKKGGLARLSVVGFSPKISGELRWLLTPKQIRKMA